MAARVAILQIGIRMQPRLAHLQVRHQVAAGGIDVAKSKGLPFQVVQGTNGGMGGRNKVAVELQITAALHQRHYAKASMRFYVSETTQICEVKRAVAKSFN